MFDRLRKLGAQVRQRPGRALAIAALGLLVAAGLAFAGAHAWAEYHFRAARTELEGDHFSEARRHVQCTLRVRPSSIEVHLLAARIARRGTEAKEAREHLEECERLAKGKMPPAVFKERLMLAAQEGSLGAIEGRLWAFIEEDDPEKALVLEALARGYMAVLRLDRARDCLDRLLELWPQSVRVRLWRGAVCERLHDMDGAFGEYWRAVELAPENDVARLALAEVLLARNSTAAAAKHFELLQERGFVPPNLYVGLARCRMSQSRFDEARDLLDECLAKYPDNIPALTERGKLALEQGHLKEAEPFLRRACELSPYEAASNFALAKCLHGLGKDSEAQRYEAVLKQIDKDSHQLHDLLRVQSAARLTTEQKLELGRLFLYTGKEAWGLFWLDQILRDDPEHRPTHQLLTDYYTKLGRKEQASYHRQFLVR